MALRKAIGAVKDQTSISIAIVASNLAPDLEVAIVKATSHDDYPADEKYIIEVLNCVSVSRGYVSACISMVSKRLRKTRDWIVALKALVLVHRILSEGNPLFQQEIMYATTRKGARVLNVADFRDEAHSNSWDHSAFVRAYALYLDQKLEYLIFEKKGSNGGGRDDMRDSNYGFRRSRSFGESRESGRRDEEMDKGGKTPLKEMHPNTIFAKMGHSKRLLDRFLSCRPTGLAKINRMILLALYPIVKESFLLYADICEGLSVLLDKFFDMEYKDCVRAFEAYASTAKQIDELISFYNWCKDIGVARSLNYPEVQRITEKLLETLHEFVRDRANLSKSPERKEKPVFITRKEEEPTPNMNEILALPPPEYSSPLPLPATPPPEPQPTVIQTPEVIEDLMNLRDDPITADDQGNKFALALFASPLESTTNGSWEAFNLNEEQTPITSAWQNPAAETGKADWELALVESTSNLSKQKAELGGGLDPLLLNGMYDLGIVTKHVNTSQFNVGSSSSVVMPGLGQNTTPVLALPAPDGTFQNLGHEDPFAASLSVPPPAYVQMSDMEKKQQLLMQEKQLWNQYATTGMQGQTSLAQMMPYGTPQAPSGYYYPPY